MLSHWRRLSVLLLATPLAANAQGRAFELSDWYRVTRLAGATLSPDGNTVAFTVTTVKEAENKRHNEVWIQSVTGGPARRMTSPNFESASPRWSPDGKTLYFTSERPGGRGTEWAVRMDEGGEAFPVDAAAAGGGAAGGRGGRGGRGGGGGGAGAQPADKSFTITAGNSSGGGNAGRGGRGGRGGDVQQAGAPDPNDPYAKMLPLARPPQGSITKPINAARFDGRHFIDERTRSNDAGFIASTGSDRAAALRHGGGGGGEGRQDRPRYPQGRR